MERQYDTLLFDLDGTLTDSAPGILDSVRYAFAKMGMQPPDDSQLRRLIGPPLATSFSETYGFDAAHTAAACTAFRERFVPVGMYDNAVYPGIEALLRRLKAQGYRLMVVTAKPELFAQRILEHFGLKQYFCEVQGADFEESTAGKGEVIAALLARVPIDPARTLMIGDRSHDAAGAAQNGIDCVGVLYGYGSREELESAGAQRLVATVEALEALLLPLHTVETV